MQTIQRRPFGSTGLEVTELSFGAMNIRTLMDDNAAIALVHHALDMGINLIDVARAYEAKDDSGNVWHCEDLLRRGMQSYDKKIEEPIIIVTKTRGYDVESFHAEFQTSVETLGIEYKEDKLYIGDIEIKLVLFFHGINELRYTQINEPDGPLKDMLQLKEEGKIHFTGFSSHYGDADCIIKAIESGNFDVCELPYNIFNRQLEDYTIDIMKHVHDHGMALINMKAFGGGSFAKLYSMMDDLVSIDYAQMLRFCLANPYVSTVDVGARYPHELDYDLNAVLQPALDEKEKQTLMQQADKAAPYLDDVCRSCLHCQEEFACPQELDFPSILVTYAKYNVATAMGKPTAHLFEEYAAYSPNAADCIECALCMPECEYKLDIPHQLKQAHKLLSK